MRDNTKMPPQIHGKLLGAAVALNAIIHAHSKPGSADKTKDTLFGFRIKLFEEILPKLYRSPEQFYVKFACTVVEALLLFDQFNFGEASHSLTDEDRKHARVIVKNAINAALDVGEGKTYDTDWTGLSTEFIEGNQPNVEDVTPEELSAAATALVQPRNHEGDPLVIPELVSITFIGRPLKITRRFKLPPRWTDVEPGKIQQRADYPDVRSVRELFDTHLALNTVSLLDKNYLRMIKYRMDNILNSMSWYFSTLLKILNLKFLVQFKSPPESLRSDMFHKFVLASLVLSSDTRNAAAHGYIAFSRRKLIGGERVSPSVSSQNAAAIVACQTDGLEYLAPTAYVRDYLSSLVTFTVENVVSKAVLSLEDMCLAYAVFLTYFLYQDWSVIELARSLGHVDYLDTDCGTTIDLADLTARGDDLDLRARIQYWLQFVVARENLVASVWARIHQDYSGACATSEDSPLPKVDISGPKNTVIMTTPDELEAASTVMLFKPGYVPRANLAKFSTMYRGELTKDTVSWLFSESMNGVGSQPKAQAFAEFSRRSPTLRTTAAFGNLLAAFSDTDALSAAMKSVFGEFNPSSV